MKAPPTHRATTMDKLLDSFPDIEDREELVAAYIALAVVAGHELCNRVRTAEDRKAATGLLVQHAEDAINNDMFCYAEHHNKPTFMVDRKLFPEIPFGTVFLEIKPLDNHPFSIANALSLAYRDLAISLKVRSTARGLEAENGKMLPTETAKRLLSAVDTVKRSWPRTIQAALELIT